jgi:hypothetical protein
LAGIWNETFVHKRIHASLVYFIPTDLKDRGKSAQALIADPYLR